MGHDPIEIVGDAFGLLLIIAFLSPAWRTRRRT